MSNVLECLITSGHVWAYRPLCEGLINATAFKRLAVSGTGCLWCHAFLYAAGGPTCWCTCWRMLSFRCTYHNDGFRVYWVLVWCLLWSCCCVYLIKKDWFWCILCMLTRGTASHALYVECLQVSGPVRSYAIAIVCLHQHAVTVSMDASIWLVCLLCSGCSLCICVHLGVINVSNMVMSNNIGVMVITSWGVACGIQLTQRAHEMKICVDINLGLDSDASGHCHGQHMYVSIAIFVCLCAVYSVCAVLCL